MSQDRLKQTTAKRMRFWGATIVTAFVVFWLVHPYLLSWALRRGLEMICASKGFVFQAEKVKASINGPTLLEGVRIRPADGIVSATSFDVARIEWKWLDSLFSDSGRLIHEMAASGIVGTLDIRNLERQSSAHAYSSFSGKKFDAGKWLRWVPLVVSVQAPSIEILGDGQRWAARDIKAVLSERETGRLEIGGVLIQAGSISKSFQSIQAVTAWKKGTIWLAGMNLLPGLTVENISIDLIQPKGPAVSLQAAVFGGSLRADLSFGSSDGAATWDLAAWAANVSLEELPPLLEMKGRAAGRLIEGRFTFRGQPEKPADAEASLRLVADGFRWNDRGWESLEVGASLIHRRLVVTNFDLRQKENHVNFNGEVSLAEGWSEISNSPFLLNVKAEIKELGVLAGVLGAPLDEAAGRMSAVGSVTGRQGQLDGFLSVEASGIEFRSLLVNSMRVEAVFRQNEIQIARCEAYSGKDTLQATGNIGLTAPHHYAAELNASIADLAAYLVPFRAPGANKIYAGSMVARWQGDGSTKAHSGAFDLQLDNFVSGLTPAGLTGKFSGTYSPQNLYFSMFQIENGPLRLESRATVASLGITLKDAELRNGNSVVLEGSAFFPINTFAVLAGTDWRAATAPDREFYIRAATSSKDLNLRDLMRLAGQNLPLHGMLRMNLEGGGSPTHPHAEGSLAAHGISLGSDGTLPEASLEAQLSIKEDLAVLDGFLQTRGFSPLTLKTRLPFGLVKTDSGDWRWINPQQAFEVSLGFPHADLSMFRSFFPRLRHLNGEVSGGLIFSQTLAKPQAKGRIELKGMSFEAFRDMLPFRDGRAVILFDGMDAHIERFEGKIGSDPFEITGNINFANPLNPKWDIRLRGEKISLVDDKEIQLRINVDIKASGNNDAGRIDGYVRLVDGRIHRRFEITPLLVSLPQKEPDFFEPPIVSGRIPNPFGLWTMDIKIENETPFFLQNTLAVGEIIPSLMLTGTLGHPVPVGRITLKDLKAFLPFTTLTISDGRIDFLPDVPWIPMLDVRATAKSADCQLEVCAFGPLNERKLILRSEPPLPQESLLLFFTTGTAPGMMSLLRTSDHDFDFVNGNSHSERLQNAVALTTPNGKFHLWDNGNVSEQDGFQLYNNAASYTWRLR